MSTYRQMVKRLGGRYGLPLARALEDLKADNDDSEDYYKAVYNRAVYLADYKVRP